MSILEIKDLQMRFGGLMALADFTLKLPPGELHGLIGPNGAGKTTVFNLLSGFYRPTAGEIIFQGASILGLPPQVVVRRGIARTFQNIKLFQELSVLDNVRIAFHCRRRTHLWQAVLRLPCFLAEERSFRGQSMEVLTALQLADVAEDKAGQLPYGRQRRLEIARALATAPKLLLLDEPAAGLNPHESAELMGLLLDLQQRYNLSILLIEHDMKFLMPICQRLTVLDHGLIIAQGPPAAVRSDRRVIQAYLGEDAGA
ncbi:ABC transporter ATP-binding protein [Desulfobacca acetoxidans]|uniref:Monosaccharide-transporting ATPase n=1 Tax=Desulfobacca acetoxidans (strain ATCC 700848 / DSM 11109 / ASRB2) TaxID=880072 RepID=F2NCH5_DESAR|nr:ABC transporter ATP-binding protein [Desulfobacca acetoxidans]AEB09109.1 Monosaccharide-transporting ATPase [Desulfobacca acetoxidans DSM 11109]